MPRITLKWSLVALAIFGASGLIYNLTNDKSESEQHTKKPTSVVANSSKVTPLNGLDTMVARPVLSLATSSGNADTTDLAATFDRLAKSGRNGNPQDAFAAYRLAAECASLSEKERIAAGLPSELSASRASIESEIQKNKLSCSTLSSIQLNERSELLKIAFEANLPEAVLAYYAAGPMGDTSNLITRSDDPLVLEWRSKAISKLDQLARKGNLEALSTLSTAYQIGQVTEPDLSKAYAYQYAILEVSRLRGEKAKLGQEQVLIAMASHLSPQQVISAKVVGELIASRCCQNNS
jgi:hypothetical protein